MLFMYKAMFKNSKLALVFAVMTVLSAVSMVGTPEEDGVLGSAVDTFGAKRDHIADQAEAFAEERSVGDEPDDASGNPDAGWGSQTPVFSDYNAADEDGEPAPSIAGVSASAKPTSKNARRGAAPAGNGPMNAPLSPDAVVLDTGEIGVPVITDRELSITPN